MTSKLKAAALFGGLLFSGVCFADVEALLECTRKPTAEQSQCTLDWQKRTQEQQEREERQREAEQQAADAKYYASCKNTLPRVGMTRAQLQRVINECWIIYSQPEILETATGVREVIHLIGARRAEIFVYLRNGKVIGVLR